ncbi:MAG: N-acetylmuramoyl-L-alanine amidase [Endomicrobium sp.]|jgi:N-acetylmuramoyl-L-alanine amidase|nr:N-acetylmuramoyl-L-alanine amidase [Endomicrobium sp.]
MIKKKFIVLFFLLLAMVFSTYLHVGSAERRSGISSKVINVLIDEEPFLGVSIYKVSQQTNYFSIKEVARMYNAVLKWKPVSSQVTMYLNNSKIDINANSARVVMGKQEKKMSLPSRFINKDIYVPPEFLTSKEFAKIARADVIWNSTSSLLKITHHSNISSVQYFTMPESTQIVIQLEAPLSYNVLKSSGALVIKISRGRVRRNLIHVNNGVIKDIMCSTEGKFALIKISLQQPPKLIKTSLLSRPDRVSVDIVHSNNVDLEASLKETVIVEPKKELEVSLDEKVINGDLTSPEKCGQTQMDETIPLIENDEDNKDLKKISVAKFENNNIIDDSSSMIDDTQNTVAGVIPKQQKCNSNKRKKIIVLDAGHGGEDPGAIGPNGTKEKDINLAIVYELKTLFDNNNDYEVVLTRKDDTFIPLAGRTNIANDRKADLFVSVHCNANFDRSVNSFEVYVLSDKANDSRAAATEVLENSVLEIEKVRTKNHTLVQNVFWSLGVNEYLNDSLELCGFIVYETKQRLKIPSKDPKQANFYVLRGTHMPAVLVESAHISNYAQEAKFVSSSKFIAAVANSVYEGVVKYYANKDKKRNYE